MNNILKIIKSIILTSMAVIVGLFLFTCMFIIAVVVLRIFVVLLLAMCIIGVIWGINKLLGGI
jgi:hypothetical protein